MASEGKVIKAAGMERTIGSGIKERCEIRPI